MHRWLPAARLVALLAFVGCTSTPPPVIVPPPPPPAPTPEPVAPPTFPAEGNIPVGAAGGLYYHMVGSGRDTVLVPLGFYLEQALQPLAAAHTVVFYDPRRRGRSTSYADSTLTTFAYDVDDVERIRAAIGASKVSLVGFSYFAAVVVEYAATYPDRVSRIALLSPIEPTDSLARSVNAAPAMARIDTTRARQLVRMRAAGKDTSDAIAYCRAYWAVNAPVYVGDSTKAGRLEASFCTLPNESVRSFADHVRREMASLAPRRDFVTVAAGVRAPSLVLHGDRDLIMHPDGARRWAAVLTDARLLTLPGGGHMLYVDDADAVLRALRVFLGGAWPAGAVVVR